jgi:CRP-like cAMP-binding protein
MDYSAKVNKMLAALPHEDLTRIAPELEPVTLRPGQSLFRYGEKVHYAYFPLTAVVSLVCLLEEGKSIEVGMTGPEGLVGSPAVFGPAAASQTAEVLIPGSALRIRVESLKKHLGWNEPLHRQLALHVWSLLAQFSRQVACSLCHQIPERLARWLLTLQDRTGGNEFRLTHEQIAEKLSIRRSGVTLQLGSFERMGAIESGRRRVRVIDRGNLKMISCECYKRLAEEAELTQDQRPISELGVVFPTPFPAPQSIRVGTQV